MEEIVDLNETPEEATTKANGEDENEDQRDLVEPKDANCDEEGRDEIDRDQISECDKVNKPNLEEEEEELRLDEEEPKLEIEEPRRKRGAALKISSFKEMSINT